LRRGQAAPYVEAAPKGAAFLFVNAIFDGCENGKAMIMFRKTTPPKTVMFAVHYDDKRTAYLWVDDIAAARDSIAVGAIARQQQKQGALPEGKITSLKRVR
jgi:hypothetical protein